MAKKIRIVLTLQLPAGKATPAPPVGTALGPHGINIVEFTKSYNEKTADKAGQIIPAQITVFEDRSFSSSGIGSLRTPGMFAPPTKLVTPGVLRTTNQLSGSRIISTST